MSLKGTNDITTSVLVRSKWRWTSFWHSQFLDPILVKVWQWATWSGRILDILQWFWVLLVLLLFTTAIYQRGAMELKCATSSDTSYLSSKRSFALRLSLEVRRGGVVAGGSHKSKMVQFSSQLLPECTHSVFAAKVPNKDLEVSHLRQKPHQDLWGHISGGQDQSWEPPLTNSWAFLPPVRNWGSCQDLVLPLHPLGAQGTATTIGVE